MKQCETTMASSSKDHRNSKGGRRGLIILGFLPNRIGPGYIL